MRIKSLATMISRSVVEHLKVYADSIIPDFQDYHCDLLIQVCVVDRSEEDSETGVLKATYNSLSQTIKVEVVAPYDITGAWFSKFIPTFKRMFRHELEHYIQHRRGGLQGDLLVPLLTVDGSFKGTAPIAPWRTVGEAVRYLLNPLEIEAHVVGIQREARARRIKFHVALKDVIDLVATSLRTCGFDESKVGFVSRRVYQVWGFYALTRYPSLRRKLKPRKVFVQKSFDFPIDE